MSRALLLLQWLGPFPPWMPCFLASCARVESVRWLILHDAPAPENPPKNVRFVFHHADEFRERVRARLGVEAPAELGYKLCDFKVAYGRLFEEYLENCDYFGWTDLDLVYGDLDRLLRPLFGHWDVLSFHGGMLSSHLCLLRNTAEHRALFERIADWKKKFACPDHLAIDDCEFSQILLQNPRARFVEHFSTPFVNWMPWTDGTYAFPRRWLWNRGQITNNLDVGYEFLYFHFMVWKGGRKPYYVPVTNWEKLPPSALGAGWRGEAFTLDETGIASARPRPVSSLRLMSGELPPRRDLIRRLRIKLQNW